AALPIFVVTAQRREQSMQDVGIAMSVVTGDTIQRLGIQQASDIVKITPGVNVSSNSGGFATNFSIRGVTQNNSQPHEEGPVAVYVDEAYQSYLQTQGLALFDVERIEALKGPHGTLFGRNATGGLISIVTRKPTEELEGFADLSYGRFNSTRLEAAVGGPLGGGFTGRVSALVDHRDEIHENVIGPDTWKNDTLAGRIQVRYENDDFEALLSVHGGRQTDTNSSGLQAHAAISVMDSVAGGQVNARYLRADVTAQSI